MALQMVIITTLERLRNVLIAKSINLVALCYSGLDVDREREIGT